MPAKYAIHPGLVFSDTDRDRHWIGPIQLANLYGLASSEYVIWDESEPCTFQGLLWEDYVHLFPRHDGKYERPK